MATHRRASDTSAVQHRWGSREELPPPTPQQKCPLSYKFLRGRAPRDVKVSGEKTLAAAAEFSGNQTMRKRPHRRHQRPGTASSGNLDEELLTEVVDASGVSRETPC